MIKKSESCEPRYIYQNLEATKDEGDKIKYISDTLERCAISDTAPTTKKKRGMSGYNCYNKVQYKAEKKIAKQENRKPIPYIKMVKTKGWSQEDQKAKDIWKNLASEGCPPRLWGE